MRGLVGWMVLVSAALAACSSIEQYDVWIRGGTVVDGTGAVPFEADVLVHGGEQAGSMRGTTLLPWSGIGGFDWSAA